MPPYASDGQKVVVLDTDNEEVQVDNEGDMFIVRYEVNRVTVIEEPKSRVEGLYVTVRYVNRTVGHRNDGQNELYESVGKRKKAMEALTLYKQKKDKILLANQSHAGGLKPGGNEDWKIKLVGNPSPINIKYPWWIPKFSNIPRGIRLTAERIAGLMIETGITNQERNVLMQVLYNREARIAFDFTEKGVFKPEVEPPHIIPTIQHKPWQAANFRVPKALEGEVVDIVKKKLECGALERCCELYHNPWFLVPKKNGGYRLINAAQRLNAVTIKDASLPLSSEEYSEDFTGFPLLSLLDLFSGYDQCKLDPSSQDMTAFQTPLGLLRMTALPQEYTNGVQVFYQVMKKILKDQIAAGIGKPFIDDVAVKPASQSMFLDKHGIPEEVALGI